MRIRTDGDYSYRTDTIEQCSNFYGRNKTWSLLAAAEDVPQLVDGVRDVLNRDDLTPEQKQEIAETFNSKGVTVEIDESVLVDLG
jgi:hypothetical protein